MLFQLYYLFEYLLTKTIEDLRDNRPNYQNFNVFKILLLCVGCIIGVGGIIYSMRSFYSHCQLWLLNIFNWRNLGLLGWARFLIKSFNEIKFSIVILIAVLIGFNLSYNQYINRQNAVLLDLIHIPDDEEVDITADLNLNDRQNVHNGTVARHVVDAIKKLIEKEKLNGIKPQPLSEIYHEIRDYLINSDHLLSNIALDVLDQIHNFNSRHVASNLTEMEILRLVWQRIKHPVNEPRKSDLEEALLTQLGDCKPHGIIMCLTGRITRIIQTLECIDAENIVDLKPLWAIKENIADYFGKYSNKLINKVPAQYKKAYEAIHRTEEEKRLVKQFNQCLRTNLYKKFKIMYIDKNILNDKQLEELSKSYFEEIEAC